MMKPNIVDVIEYVKAGEDDPQMGSMLRRDPDGPELLKQARFICAVLEHQSETAEDGGIAASFDVVASSRSEVMREPAGDSLMDVRPAAFLRAKPSFSARERISPYGRDTEDLGTLEFAVEGEVVAVSYRPSASVMRRYGKTPDAFESVHANIDGIEIRGRSMTFTLPDRLAAGEPATVRVTRGPKRLPAANFGLTFMPESGPFTRIARPDKGIAQLPVPEQSGTLLITGGTRPQLLHLNLKK